jgi:hypothetical protein
MEFIPNYYQKFETIKWLTLRRKKEKEKEVIIKPIKRLKVKIEVVVINSHNVLSFVSKKLQAVQLKLLGEWQPELVIVGFQ